MKTINILDLKNIKLVLYESGNVVGWELTYIPLKLSICFSSIGGYYMYPDNNSNFWKSEKEDLYFQVYEHQKQQSKDK